MSCVHAGRYATPNCLIGFHNDFALAQIFKRVIVYFVCPKTSEKGAKAPFALKCVSQRQPRRYAFNIFQCIDPIVTKKVH